MRLSYYIIGLFLALLPAMGRGEESKPLSLSDAISLARAQSVDAAVAANELKAAYWEYRSYRADLLPEVGLSASAPSFRRQYSPYMNADGSYSFVRNNYIQMNGEVSVSQSIWATGGKLSLSSSLDYMKQLERGANPRFMSVPIAVTLQQPLFGTNHIKWNRQIAPLRFTEAKGGYISATEEIAVRTVASYFALIMAEENLQIARQNIDNARKLYSVAKEKREMGRISGNDLLQMELNMLNAESELSEAESNRRSALFDFRSLLALDDSTQIQTNIPSDIPDIRINFNDALDKALKRNKFASNIRRRQLEADFEVAKARGEMRQISLFAQLGFTGTDSHISNAYSNLGSNQILEVGINIPLLDWGKRRGKVRMAESNRKVVESKLRQESDDFSRNLYLLIERFANQQRRVEIAQRADTIAQTRYNANVETYLIGKISTLDLNDSRISKDKARRDYINELYSFWNYFYQIRSITLWDYSSNSEIDTDFNPLFQ